MSTRQFLVIRSLLIVLLAAWIAIATGCGGGSATPGPTPTPTPSTTTVAITFSDPKPVAFAEKIGTGNWTSATLPSSGTLLVQLPSGTTQYGVAFLCTSTRSGSQVNVEQILEADSRDGTTFSLQLCLPDSSGSPPTGSFTGTFDASAIPGTNSVQISIDGFSRTAGFGTTTGSFNITGLTGMTDAYAVAFNSSNVPLAMKVVRSQTVPGIANGGSAIALSASDAVTTLQPISIVNNAAGLNPPTIIHFPSYVTANGSVPVEIGGFFIPTQYAVVPPPMVQPGDYYLFDLGASGATQFVTTTQYLRTTGPVTLTLPAPWAATPPTPASFPTFIFNYTGLAGQPAVADEASIGWTLGSTFFAVDVVATANHQVGATNLTMPDLTAVPGFFAMAPTTTKITWVARTWGGTAQFYLGTSVIPQTISNASDQGSYTQP
jgi:hypothetical protein